MNALEPAPDAGGVDHSVGDYEYAPCGLVSTALDGTITRVNETLVRQTGLSRDELVGAPFVSFLEAGSQLLYETRYLPTLHLQGEVNEVAFAFRHSSGRRLPILVNGMLVRDDEGSPLAVRMAVFGSSQRQRYERELLSAQRLAESSEAQVRILHSAADAFAESATASSLAHELARSVRDAFAASEVSVYLLDETGAPSLVSGAAAPAETALLRSGTPGAAWRSHPARVVSRADASVAGLPGLAEGMRDARVETVSIVPLVDDERHVGVLVSAFRRARTFGDRDTQLQDALARMATQALTRLRLREELEQLALYDPLTGLAHRPLFLERLRDAVTASRTDDRPMALIFVDLDGFKAINDNRGHGAGDLVLSEMGRRLSSAVRRDDLVARFGGDEFVILCRDADPAAVHRVADRLLAAIREPLPDPSMVVTGSMGIALMRGSDDEEVTAEVLLETADEAMYRSKRSGRDRATIVVAASPGAD